MHYQHGFSILIRIQIEGQLNYNRPRLATNLFIKDCLGLVKIPVAVLDLNTEVLRYCFDSKKFV
jgi:hypothetical protein